MGIITPLEMVISKIGFAVVTKIINTKKKLNAQW